MAVGPAPAPVFMGRPPAPYYFMDRPSFWAVGISAARVNPQAFPVHGQRRARPHSIATNPTMWRLLIARVRARSG